MKRTDWLETKLKTRHMLPVSRVRNAVVLSTCDICIHLLSGIWPIFDTLHFNLSILHNRNLFVRVCWWASLSLHIHAPHFASHQNVHVLIFSRNAATHAIALTLARIAYIGVLGDMAVPLSSCKWNLCDWLAIGDEKMIIPFWYVDILTMLHCNPHITYMPITHTRTHKIHSSVYFQDQSKRRETRMILFYVWTACNHAFTDPALQVQAQLRDD